MNKNKEKAEHFKTLAIITGIFAVLNFLSLMEAKSDLALGMYIFNMTLCLIFKGRYEHYKEKSDNDKKLD